MKVSKTANQKNAALLTEYYDVNELKFLNSIDVIFDIHGTYRVDLRKVDKLEIVLHDGYYVACATLKKDVAGNLTNNTLFVSL